VLKKAALVVAMAGAIVGLSSPAFAAEAGKTDIVPSIPGVGGLISGASWQPCAGNQATGVGGNVAVGSPTLFEGGCENGLIASHEGLLGSLASWQPCAVNQFTGVGGNVALNSPGAFHGGCVNSSIGHGH
jgi:hypothetical protein